ncbi:hypothetical protein [Lysinibacter sp. HNR]|uniref:hypothetical protein n=1 Tax=Lysinibacter sp. HNR TaxID=3031408 RepID=UPI002435C718|nr:hypothetical protein [Lysinibacter sp. HNR]WGD37831.1 hypothetical protein FrondiHNR_02650 [Lysinibacter sp. HNR]
MSVHSLELSARTLLFTEEITGLEDFVHHPDDVLVDIIEQPEESATLWRERRLLIPGWSAGAVLIGYGGKPLIDLTMWDAVWPLWSHLVTVVEEYLDAGRSEISFPTQPIDFLLYDRGGNTFALVGDTEMDVHRESFIDQLLLAAHQFFDWIEEFTDDDAAHELERVAELLAARRAE